MKMDRWAELRTAYQVAKLGTVSAAAEAIGYHRATVNRHIDLLEAEFGARIFIRHARGYALTEVGEDVLRVAEKTESLIDDLAGRVQGGKAQIDGEIKLTILAPFAGILMPAVTAFRAENPQCTVVIDAIEDLAKLEYGEAHIALRAGAKPDHPDYVVHQFGKVGFSLYAHDNYVAQHGLPKHANDLGNHRFVVPPVQNNAPPFAAWIKEHVRQDQIAMASRDIWVSVEAIAAGVGIGFMANHEAINRGSFHAVLPPNKAWSVPLWLVTHVDLHRTQKVQAMSNWLKSASRQTQAPFR